MRLRPIRATETRSVHARLLRWSIGRRRMERADSAARRARRQRCPLEVHAVTAEPPQAELRARRGTLEAQLATRERRQAAAPTRLATIRARRAAPGRHLRTAAIRPRPAARPLVTAARPQVTAARPLVTAAPRQVTAAPRPVRQRIHPGILETRLATAGLRPGRARSRREAPRLAGASRSSEA
jgi:hypothetical protein